MRHTTLTLTATALFGCAAAQLSAGVMNSVIPGAYENAPGTSSFVGPMATGERTYQMLIHESLLTDLIGRELTGIAWRLPASASGPWPGSDLSYSDYSIYLSGSVAPADRSLTFAENVVGAQTQVRSGGLSVDAGSYGSGGSPNSFGPSVGFDNWVYGGGHLLVEIRHSGNGVASRAMDALSTSTAGYGELFSAAWASSSSATSGLQGNFTIFEFTSIPVPGALFILTSGCALLGGRGRRRG